MEENNELDSVVTRLAKYDKEKDNAHETVNKDQAEYDKQLLTLSAAFLGAALAFVKDVVPLKDAVHLWVFDLALVLLLVCVGVVLFSFQYSIHGNSRLVEYWERMTESLVASGDEKNAIDDDLNKRLKWLNRKEKRIEVVNRASGVLFILGAILLGVFVVINMHHEAHFPTSFANAPAKQTTPCVANGPTQLDQKNNTTLDQAPRNSSGTGVNLTEQNPPPAKERHK